MSSGTYIRMSPVEEGVVPARVDKNDVLEWFLQSDEAAVLWVLKRVTAKRPTLMMRAEEREETVEEVDKVKSKPRLKKQVTSGEVSDSHFPIVQFGSATTFCREGSQEALIDVIRVGDVNPRVEVRLKTIASSAKPGSKYVDIKEQIVVLKPGEWDTKVKLQLIDDENWDPNTELGVELMAEGIKNATLGRYLWKTRVKIIDDDPFPTNKYKEQLLAHTTKDTVPTQNLFFEYLKMNYRNKIIRSRSQIVMLIGQLDNAIYLLELFAGVYLVDYVFDMHHHHGHLIFVQDRQLALALTSFCFIGPFAFVHYCHYWRAGLGHVGGNCRKTLQAAMLRQYLNFDHIARSNLRSSDLVMSTTRSAHLLVGQGYKAAIRLVERIGHLGVVLAFQILSPILFNRDMSWTMFFFPLVIFPALAISFLLCRQRLTSDVLHKRFEQQDNFADYIEQTVENYQLIADYEKRTETIDHFEKRIGDFNTANREANVVLLNNAYFIDWIGKVMVFAWSLVGGIQVLNGNLSLGIFLVNIRICKGICKSWRGIYGELLDIETVFPLLEHLVEFINTRTDVDVRETLSRHNWEMTSEFVGKNGKHFSDLQLQMSNVHFSYESKSQRRGTDGNLRGMERVTNLRGQGLLEVHPGELVCLVGPRGGGKSTVLKLLGGQILPSEDQISELSADSYHVHNDKIRFYVPAHLRLLTVTTEAMFIQGTLYENLVYGVQDDPTPKEDPDAKKKDPPKKDPPKKDKHDADADRDRVTRICKKLGMGNDVLQELERNEVHKWGSVISQTQKHLLCIARALIANPEVLCLHKPTMILDAQHTENVNELLLEFVRNAGIEQDHADRSLAGPRTCIYTTTKDRMATGVDKVFHISVSDGIRLENGSAEDKFGKSKSELLCDSY